MRITFGHRLLFVALALPLSFFGGLQTATADEAAVLPPIPERYRTMEGDESPDFQRHVAPLLGRLGCNGRSCHGSFQGRGGFRLSLFGYDFRFDHEALAGGGKENDKRRISIEQPDESLILVKPLDADNHEGGKRFEQGSWQHHVLRRWIKDGGKYDGETIQTLQRLEVTPNEIVATQAGQKVALKAIAVWSNGVREDVTPLCRFQANDDQVARINEDGQLTTGEPGDTHVVVFYDNAVVPVPVIRPVTDQVGPRYPTVAAPTKIDQLVIDKLRKLGVIPSDLCTDAEFLRRVSLDLTGTLPTAAAVEAFLNNPSPNKRSEKINELLETPAYAAWWATKFCDFTGNNDRQLNNANSVNRTGATQAWYDWLEKRIAENMPYDQIVEGIVLGSSRRPDQSYTEYCEEMSDIYRPGSDKSFADRPTMPYYWARQNVRQPEDKVIAFAYSFMGVRIQCAQCHKHPFDTWSKEDFDRFKPFFGYVRFANQGPKDEFEKIVAECGAKDLRGNDLQKKLPDALKEGKTVPFPEVIATAAKGQPQRNRRGGRSEPTPVNARLLNGEVVDLSQYADARLPLMNWLRSKDNPFFARALVNRVWATYFHAGIVEPPDDMSLANPPRNAALLDYLAQQFIAHDFDLKWLHREILTSATYQRSWQTNATNEKDEKNFSRAVPRRMPAEVAVDAFLLAVASDAKAATSLKSLGGRAISVPGSSAQNRGGNDRQVALQVFGRSTRESNCDCDRSNEASLLQTVFLQNDPSVVAALNGGKDSWIEQLAQQFKIRLAGNPDNARDARRREEAKRELAKTRQRLERAVKDEAENDVKRLKERIAQIEKYIGESNDKPAGDSTNKPAADTVPTETIIRQAYLRTLSRYPTDSEVTRCSEYFAAAANPVEGAKGLLWALVNTKEFIVNH